MISADISGGRIALDVRLASPAEQARLRQVRGVQRVKGGDLTAPLYPAVAEDLRRSGVQLSKQLLSYLRYAARTADYVNAQKTQRATPAPLLGPMPIKPAYKPYGHQVRAYNISLALLLYLHGWDEEAG